MSFCANATLTHTKWSVSRQIAVTYTTRSSWSTSTSTGTSPSHRTSICFICRCSRLRASWSSLKTESTIKWCYRTTLRRQQMLFASFTLRKSRLQTGLTHQRALSRTIFARRMANQSTFASFYSSLHSSRRRSTGYSTDTSKWKVSNT